MWQSLMNSKSLCGCCRSAGLSHTEERKLQTLWLLSVFGQSFRISDCDLVSRKTLPFRAFWPSLLKPVSSASHGPSKDKRSSDRCLIDDLLRSSQKTFFAAKALNDRDKTEMKIEQKSIWLIVKGQKNNAAKNGNSIKLYLDFTRKVNGYAWLSSLFIYISQCFGLLFACLLYNWHQQ